MAIYKVISLNIIIFCSIPAIEGGIGEPAIGDIQLVPLTTKPGYYQPLVYFTNGIEPPQWGAICYDGIIKADARVICNQVGFELDDNFPYSGSSYAENSYPIWFDDVLCDENKPQQHILNCKYKVAFGTQRYKWPCNTNEYLIIKCDMTKPLTLGKYDSQLLLCPPYDSDNTSSIFSTSFGLVIMYSSKYDTWRGINQHNTSDPLGGNEADAICRQLGFTGAISGSAVTQRALPQNYNFQHCYDDQPPFRAQSQSWLSTDEINCAVSQKCLGCCFNYPSRDNCRDCEKLNDIVIQCIFIPNQKMFSSTSTGPDSECAYNNLSCNTECANKIRQLEIALGVVVPLLAIAIVALSITSCILCILICKKYCGHAQPGYGIHEPRGQLRQQLLAE